MQPEKGPACVEDLGQQQSDFGNSDFQGLADVECICARAEQAMKCKLQPFLLKLAHDTS